MSLKQYKAASRRIAKQLGYLKYDADIISRINAASTETEVTRAMISARNKAR